MPSAILVGASPLVEAGAPTGSVPSSSVTVSPSPPSGVAVSMGEAGPSASRSRVSCGAGAPSSGAPAARSSGASAVGVTPEVVSPPSASPTWPSSSVEGRGVGRSAGGASSSGDGGYCDPPAGVLVPVTPTSLLPSAPDLVVSAL
eukprot:11446030-Ditylum_brightwellii.AAC.1